MHENGDLPRFMVERRKKTFMMSDEEFSQWFDALYTRYATDVIRVSYFYLGDRGKAEDVCHDTFVSLFVNRPELEEGGEKAWLLKVALNRCRDIWRSAWMRRVISGSPAFEMIPGPDTVGQHMEKVEIMEAVNSLAPDFREVMILYYYQGYGISEIAKITGMPEGTVSSRLSRGRKRLEAILGDKGGETA